MSEHSGLHIKSIALLRLSAMGDVILCIPAVKTLQACYPHAKITWITTSSAYAILKGLSGIEFIIIDKPNNLKEYIAVYKQLKPYYFDVLLCMQASFRANIIYPLIKSGRRIGFAVTAREGHRYFIKESIPGGQDHLLDSFMRFPEMLGCENKIYTWDLAIPSEDYEWAKQRLLSDKPRKILAINLMASKQERCWPVERYIEVIKIAKKRWDIDILLTGGSSENEKECALNVENSVGFPIKNEVGNTTPKQLAAMLSLADALLSPDTGPLHLAVAVGTPVVGLYAVAPSTLSGPYFSHNLTIDKFSEAVRIFLKKDPKKIPWQTRVHTSKAMELITVDEVIEKLSMVFE